MARRLAAEYARMVGEPFPGGDSNAFIFRSYPKRGYREHGAWTWWLAPINPTHGRPRGFGSVQRATLAVREPDRWLEVEMPIRSGWEAT